MSPDRTVPVRWSVAAHSARGSAHVRSGQPLQDAWSTWADPDGAAAVIAVADGHGDQAHFRSDTGAQLAVHCAGLVARRHLALLADSPTPGDAEDAVRTIAARTVAAWVVEVDRHRAAHPHPDPGPAPPERRLLPYGTTLLVAVASGHLLGLWQVGDGDAVAVGPDGRATRPLDRGEPHGVRTPSLCQPDPLTALRVAVLDRRRTPIDLVFCCTDGFGGPRVDPDWWRRTGDQLVGFVRERGTGWVRDQLPTWLAEPAEVGGDDTTLALMCSGVSPATRS
ncbi:PP2C family serine/threonine-protein phosphatase [Nocardioides sambongensis]|uniref:PP2C family serine/threonine-protein phosphatase n=1 Tax=Nocardioides sambongensis TaxID=2589074 RepID=UPI00112EA2D1|nr:PP2C family serine/threonine-protein phosphatase [Nocardioides sambongensis]